MLASYRRSFIAVALTAFVPVAGLAADSGSERPVTIHEASSRTSHGSRLYGYAEALFLDFEQFDADQPVAYRLLPDDSTEVVLRADDANDGAVGPRITLGWIDSDYRGWEASYFGVNGGRGVASVDGDDDLAMVGDLALGSLDFFQSDRITIESQTRLHSFELSRIWYDGNWSLLTGFRYLRIEDDFRLLSFDSDTGVGSPGEYDVRTENDLFGLQAGLRHARHSRLTRNLIFDIGGKAGIYGNSASQDQSVVEFGGTDVPFFLRGPYGDHRGQVAFVGDASANAILRLTPRLDIRAGYNLLWVEGVALAGDQLEFADVLVPQTSTSGGGLFHGASVGIAFRW